MSETEREARIDLAAAYRIACHHGLTEGGRSQERRVG